MKELCPETHGLVAVEVRSLRTHGCHNLFRFVLESNTAGMQPFSRLRTLIEMCEITSTLQARRVGPDGSMSASGLAGPGFNPRRGSIF